MKNSSSFAYIYLPLGLTLAAGLTLAGAAAAADKPQVPVKAQERMTKEARRDAWNEQLPVLKREHPDFDPLGVEMGSFMLYPSLTVGAGSDDNVNSTTSGKTSDTYLRVTPELDFKSRFKRHSASLLLRGNFNRFSKQKSDDVSTFLADAAVNLDLADDFQAGLQLTHEDAVEKRGQVVPSDAVKPGTFSRDRIRLNGSKVFDHIQLSGYVQTQKYQFDNNAHTGGGVIDFSFRDRTEDQAQARVDYAFSRNFVVFGSLTGTNRDYESTASTARDSKITNYQVGTRFNLSSLVSAEIGVGYYSQDFSNPLLKTIDGTSIDGHLDWNPTALTTISFDAVSQPADPGIAAANSAKLGTFSVQVDHELLRNLILTGRYQTSQLDLVGVDRNDQVNILDLSGTWLMSRRLALKFTYRNYDLNSSGAAAAAGFTDNEALVALQLRY